MTFDVDAIRLQIPYYLASDPKQKAFLNELEALSAGASKGYITPPHYDEFIKDLLQGDGWAGLHLYSFNDGNVRAVRGLILSNSCDVASENQRSLPMKTIFVPIVRLAAIQERLKRAGLSSEQIDAKTSAIRSQSVTNIFYLPAEAPLEEEYLALLDDTHSIPSSLLPKVTEKLFTMTMAGFYVFLFKLSIHFCRLHEKVDRRLAV
jgi:hypothetical protein